MEVRGCLAEGSIICCCAACAQVLAGSGGRGWGAERQLLGAGGYGALVGRLRCASAPARGRLWVCLEQDWECCNPWGHIVSHSLIVQISSCALLCRHQHDRVRQTHMTAGGGGDGKGSGAADMAWADKADQGAPPRGAAQGGAQSAGI